MSNLANAIELEIRKLARKEIRAQVHTLTRELAEERRRVNSLQRQLLRQAREIERLQTEAPSASSAAPSLQGWRKDTVRTTRKRFNLSQRALAKLIGVGLNSVSLWETGRVEPRKKQKLAILELRTLSEDALQTRLADVGLAEGRRKPGRKPNKKG